MYYIVVLLMTHIRPVSCGPVDVSSFVKLRFQLLLCVKSPFLFSQPSVRVKEPVCRTKCVFTLDFVDVILDFTGTSAKPVSNIITVSVFKTTLYSSAVAFRLEI